jgi:hypothetical protein
VKCLFLPLAILLFVTGCSTVQFPELGPRYVPTNIHGVAAMPPTVRRVALLPIAPHRANNTLTSGAEDLSAVLEVELRKTAMFEVVNVSESQLREWTGRGAWRTDEILPQNFFHRLHAETGCDAVLFPALTSFRPYPPLAIGLELRLVTGTDSVTLWAVDEVLDAGAAPVARAARDYGRSQIHVREGEEGAILQSPMRFAGFASATLFTTLPSREKSLKQPAKPTMTTAGGIK